MSNWILRHRFRESQVKCQRMLGLKYVKREEMILLGHYTGPSIYRNALSWLPVPLHLPLPFYSQLIIVFMDMNNGLDVTGHRFSNLPYTQ